MRCKPLTLLVFLIAAATCYSQSDTLLIHLKNGNVEKIAIANIKHINFENITSVNESKPQPNLNAMGNYPNPFTEQTAIEFEIDRTGSVEIAIFDNSGQIVRKLTCDNCTAGKNTLNWDAEDESGNQLPSGVYYYEVRCGSETSSKKMIMVK